MKPPSPLERPWRILVVDDTEGDAETTAARLRKETLAGLSVHAEPCDSFEAAPQLLQERIYDLVVLDLVKGSGTLAPSPGTTSPEEEGEKVLERIKASRPLPVVFYTAHPLKLEGKASVIVSVVDRGASPALLVEAISKIIASGVPMLARRIENIQRSYLWDFAARHSKEIDENGIANELEMLLARRLAFLLRENSLNGQSPDAVRPIEFYIYPEPSGTVRTGCIVKQRSDGNYWLVLTPHCDLAQSKATKVLLAACSPLTVAPTFTDWKQPPTSKTKTSDLKALLKGKKPQEDRYFYLPSAHSIPDLLSDFQDTKTALFSDFEKEYERVATLDSPFAEAATARFARYFGRLGTPDLDMDFVLNRLGP